MLTRRFFAFSACAVVTTLGACATTSERLAPETRNVLSVRDVTFEAPGATGYGDGIIGKRLNPGQVEPVFEAAVKKRLAGPTPRLPVTVNVAFTRFVISTNANMVLGTDPAGFATALVTIKAVDNSFEVLEIVSVNVSALFGDLPGGAFETPDAKKIEILANKFAAQMVQDFFGS